MSRRRKSRRGQKEDTGRSNMEKITKVFEVPTAILPDMAHIELIGNREAVVDGCKGVLEYDENIIRLNLGSQILIFTGEDLAIQALSENQAVVEGLIITIEYSN